jgi:hypothetical protein
MNKFHALFFFITLYWLVACDKQEIMPVVYPTTTNVVLPTVEVLPTSTEPLPTSTIAPTMTAIQSEPVITISKIHEWKASHPIAWFNHSEQFVILLKSSLDVYDSSMNLIWSVPVDRNELDSAIAVSLDDKIIALYDNWLNGVILFDSLTGKNLGKSGRDNCMVQVHTSDMLFAQNNRLIIGFDGEWKRDNWPIRIRAWDTSPLACFREQIEIPAQEGQPSSIYAMKKSSNGKYFVAISTHNYSNEHRGIIRAWDAENLSMVCETPGIYALFSPFDDSLVVMNKRGDTISYFDVEKCSETRALKLPAYPKKQEMEFTPDGKYIVLLRHGFQIIDAENGNLVLDDKSDIFAAFGVLHISPGGKYLLSEHADNGPVTALWNIDYGQVP